MLKQERNIGLDVPTPKEKCNDNHCPFHGSLVVRGRQFEGTVIRASAQKTIVVQSTRLAHVPKYERYEKRSTKIQSHISPCIKVALGDKVKIIECRPISKTKNFVVIGVEK